MKIVAKVTTVEAGQTKPLPVTLGDDSVRDFITDFLPKQSRDVQMKGGYEQEYKTPLDRFNKSFAVPWKVTRTFPGDVEACDLFVRDHPDNVPVLCDLEVTVEGSIKVYTGCAIHQVDCIDHAGESCVFQYAATLGPVSTLGNTTTTN